MRQADLLYRNGTFSLAVTLDTPEPQLESNGDMLGVDLGMVNLATDSTGETFSGEQVEKTRRRMHSLKQRLQKRGTKSAKRHFNLLERVQEGCLSGATPLSIFPGGFRGISQSPEHQTNHRQTHHAFTTAH